MDCVPFLILIALETQTYTNPRLSINYASLSEELYFLIDIYLTALCCSASVIVRTQNKENLRAQSLLFPGLISQKKAITLTDADPLIYTHIY